ncbi:MAG: M56 family metallopeptidase [Maricaulaceae bacterium]|jgi:hypothetical protein
MTPRSDLLESVLSTGVDSGSTPLFEFAALPASGATAWLAEASIVFGVVVLVVLLLRKPALRRFGAGWAYALWLAPVAALIATLAPASLIELPVLPASEPAAQTAAGPMWGA